MKTSHLNPVLWGLSLWLVVLSGPLQAQPEETHIEPLTSISELLCIGSDGRVDRNEETPEVVVVFGNVTVEGRVRRDMVVVFGTARIDGEIGGNLVAPFSRIELGPQARVRGDLVVVGGSLITEPGARIEGQRVDLSWQRLEHLPGFPAVRNMVNGVGEWLGQGLMLGRLLPASWGWWWWVTIAMALFYLLIALLAPRAVLAGALELESQPVACFFIGILGYLLVNVLLLILGATGIGVLAWPFVLMALLVVQIVGKASLYQSVGIRLGRGIGGNALAIPLLALLAGFALFTLVYMIPLLGLLAWLLVAPLGLGAALMAMFRTLRPVGDNPPPVPIPGGLPPPHTPHNQLHETETLPPPPSIGPPPVIGSAPLQLSSSAELASLPRSGFWIRTAATFLDLLVVLVPLALIGLPDYFLIPWIAYHVAFWTWKGTTVGGVVCRLKLVRLDGQPLNFSIALVRSLASFLSAIALFLGFFWVGWTRQRLAWHDRIAGTTIVRVPAEITLL